MMVVENNADRQYDSRRGNGFRGIECVSEEFKKI